MESSSDEGSDFDMGQQSVLPVETGLEDMDLEIPPGTGEAYLRRVRNEAKSLPKVVTARIDRKKIKQQTCTLPVGDVFPAPAGLVLDKEWKDEQIRLFLQNHQMVEEYRQSQGTKLKGLRKLPQPKDADGWNRLCFGKPQSSPNDAPPSDVVSRISLESPPSEGSPDLGQRKETKPSDGNYPIKPLLSIIGAIPKHQVDQILEYHVTWLEEHGFSHHQGSWLYALMISLDDHPHHETISALRTMARTCRKIRYELKDLDDPLVKELNLLICLVGQQFGQKDLAD